MRIRVDWLGRELRCTHCQGTFIARTGSESDVQTLLDSAERWLERAEELLRYAQRTEPRHI